jgi:hypothetical protein
MNELVLAQEIAKITKDTQFWAAVIGFGGVIVGAIVTFCGNLFLHWYQNRRPNSLDQLRKKLLREMLDNSAPGQGRSLETLSKVTGAQHEDCRRLLLEIKARGFTRDDGSEAWIYIKDRPLTEQ